jgi:hypothetical protein
VGQPEVDNATAIPRECAGPSLTPVDAGRVSRHDPRYGRIGLIGFENGFNRHHCGLTNGG